MQPTDKYQAPQFAGEEGSAGQAVNSVEYTPDIAGLYLRLSFGRLDGTKNAVVLTYPAIESFLVGLQQAIKEMQQRQQRPQH